MAVMKLLIFRSLHFKFWCSLATVCRPSPSSCARLLPLYNRTVIKILQGHAPLPIVGVPDRREGIHERERAPSLRRFCDQQTVLGVLWVSALHGYLRILKMFVPLQSLFMPVKFYTWGSFNFNFGEFAWPTDDLACDVSLMPVALTCEQSGATGEGAELAFAEVGDWQKEGASKRRPDKVARKAKRSPPTPTTQAAARASASASGGHAENDTDVVAAIPSERPETRVSTTDGDPHCWYVLWGWWSCWRSTPTPPFVGDKQRH